jgi:beta-phosphoglucomutase-like phosphatase (HAD superfamily)
MRSSSTPQAVLLDMDGTLVSTEDHWFTAECTVMAELGGTWGHEDQAAFVGGPLEALAASMAARAGGGVPGPTVLRRLLEEMHHLLRTEPVPWMPGARELLDELAAAEIPCALVTASYRSIVDAVLAAVGDDVTPRAGGGPFTTSVAGDEVKHPKPHPEPYLTAAAKLGADPAHCVVIEDSPTGVESGQAAGCFVVAVPSLVRIEPAERRLVVGSMLDVDVELLRGVLTDRAA